MGRPRLELGTNRLKAEYSTIELATLLFCNFAIITRASEICKYYFYKIFAVNLTDAVQLAFGANTVRFSPVLIAFRGAVQGSRQ